MKIVTVKDLNAQIMKMANPGKSATAPTMLSMLKQARTMGTQQIASPVPDFFGRFMELKAGGELDNIPGIKLPILRTKWDIKR